MLKHIASEDEDMKRFIIRNVYYLSGYVIETALSYSLFSYIGWKRDVDIEICKLYCKEFKTHILINKLAFLSKHGVTFHGCELIDKAPKNIIFNTMFNSWSEVVRYRKPRSIHQLLEIDEATIASYIDSVDKVQDFIFKKYPI